MKKFAISFTAYEDGLFTDVGCFEKLFSSAKEASDAMMVFANERKDDIEDCYGTRRVKNSKKFSFDVTEDVLDGNKDMPVLVVIRNHNGTDVDMYTWAVSQVKTR